MAMLHSCKVDCVNKELRMHRFDFSPVELTDSQSQSNVPFSAIGTLQAEAKRLEDMAPDALEDELRARLERLESRINEIRRALPASLTIARLRKAVAVLARLDAQGALENSQANGDSAKAVALRLGRAIDELELLLREVQPVNA